MEKLADSGADSTPDTRRRRACLRCSTSFESAWAGERVCPRCKSSSTWRNGSGLEARRAQSRSTPSGRS